MAEILCPNCGKENPDFFDNCQFCQAELKPESTLQPGENPAEVDTGDLEPILPEWLQDARQQSRDSEDAGSFSPETKPRIQTNEPLDLLAGLAAQDDSDEDEVPDWLVSINPVEDKKSTLPSASDKEEEPSDFFAQFSQSDSQPASSQADSPEQDDGLASLMGGMEQQDEPQADELGGWFSQSSDQGEPETDGSSWMDNLGSTESSTTETPEEKESEDLGWLHDLENASRETGDLSSPQVDAGSDLEPSQSESSGEDLSWLNDLGGTPMESAEATLPLQPESSQDDSDWLKNLGGESTSLAEDASSSQPESSQEDLGWLSNLGGPEPSASDEPAPSQPESSGEDMSWLSNLGDEQSSVTDESKPVQSESSDEDLSWMANLGSSESAASEEPAPSQPESSGEDLSWLSNLGDERSSVTEEAASTQSKSTDEDLSWMANLGAEESESATDTESVEYTPPRTAPLDENAGRDSTPDWLKSAMEEPSMPAPGDLSMDWFGDEKQPEEAETADTPQETSDFQMDEASAQTQDESAPDLSGFDLPLEDSSAASSQDVDALFNIDMPELESHEDSGAEISQSEADESIASGDEALAPVELPSWVQAMRPVGSAISETSYVDDEEQEPESEGPLAGFSGVIPSAPIGSSLRPKAFSMKLQVSEEQQAGAALIEQIIASETAAHPSKATTMVASQRTLRWVLSGLFLIALSLVLGFGWQNFDILATEEERALSSLIETIPADAPVLLVVDYEPAVAGEIAAAAGPVLDQLAQSKRSTFTFVSMSPNGSAMVDHLMVNTGAGDQYFNVGFLPGGSAGVLGFINDPVTIMPRLQALTNVSAFSSFEAVVLLTDNAESGRVWVEQLDTAKQIRPEIAFKKPLIVVSSAQAGPMLEPYVSSGQVNVMINGLSDAAKYEFLNQSRPGNARAYWDSFGIGLMIAIFSIVLGSIWSIFMGIRERRLEAEQG